MARKIEVINNAGVWEEMLCDKCLTNSWDIAEEYGDPDFSTGFVCCNCGADGPIVKDTEWREVIKIERRV